VDGLLVAGSYMLAYYIKFESIFADKAPGGRLPMEVYFSALYFLVPAYLLLYYIVQLYTSRRALRLWNEFIDIVQANVMGVIGFLVVLYMINQPDFSRTMIGIFFVLNITLTTIAHWLLRRFLQFIRKKGYNIKHILLVGYSRAAEAYISRILENPQWGYVIAGVLDDFVPIDTSYHGVKVIGKIDQLGSLLESNNYDEITITLPLDDYDRLELLVADCEKSGVHTKFIPDYTSLFPSNPYTEDVQGLPVINIRYVPLSIPLTDLPRE
jgi:FlaA1/EpsC-like NDP-sugar epimerase